MDDKLHVIVGSWKFIQEIHERLRRDFDYELQTVMSEPKCYVLTSEGEMGMGRTLAEAFSDLVRQHER